MINEQTQHDAERSEARPEQREQSELKGTKRASAGRQKKKEKNIRIRG